MKPRNTKVPVWLASLLSPLVGFLVVPLVTLVFSLLFSSHLVLINRVTLVVWLFSIPLSYLLVVVVLIPTYYYLNASNRFSIGIFVAVGAISGVVGIFVFGITIDDYWVSLSILLSSSVALTFGYLVSPHNLETSAE